MALEDAHGEPVRHSHHDYYDSNQLGSVSGSDTSSVTFARSRNSSLSRPGDHPSIPTRTSNHATTSPMLMPVQNGTNIGTLEMPNPKMMRLGSTPKSLGIHSPQEMLVQPFVPAPMFSPTGPPLDVSPSPSQSNFALRDSGYGSITAAPRPAEPSYPTLVNPFAMRGLSSAFRSLVLDQGLSATLKDGRVVEMAAVDVACSRSIMDSWNTFEANRGGGITCKSPSSLTTHAVADECR